MEGPVLIKAAGGSYTDTAGRTWSDDHEWLGGGGGAFDGSGLEVEGTDEDGLYRDHRWGMSGIDIDVPRRGDYEVRLLFAEVVMAESGRRIFDVTAEGEVLVDDIDVFATAGFAVAMEQSFLVHVPGRTLHLRFRGVVEEPMISAIAVTSAEGDELPATTTTDVSDPPTTTTDVSDPPATQPELTTTPPAPSTSTSLAPPMSTTTQPTTTTSKATPPAAPARPASGFPNAGNTGVPPGTVLRPSGSITTVADGQVIDAVDVTGSIRVEHSNVTIRRSRIRRPHGQAITMRPDRVNLLIEDCELDGTGNTTADAAVGDTNYTMRRCDVHHFGEGPRTSGNNVVEDSWMHDFLDFVADGAHQDALQMTGGRHVVIRHNTLDMNVNGANAVIMLGSYTGDDVLIENNWLAGGGYSVYGGASNNYTNVRIVNNRFSAKYYPRCGYHGPLVYAENAVVSGNTYLETGAPI